MLTCGHAFPPPLHDPARDGRAECASKPGCDASKVHLLAHASYVDFHIDQKEIDACDGKVESYKNRHDRLYDHDPLSSAQLQASAAVVGRGVGNAADPNDGMVTVASAKWGVFRGCFPTDHMDEVARPTLTRHVTMTMVSCVMCSSASSLRSASRDSSSRLDAMARRDDAA